MTKEIEAAWKAARELAAAHVEKLARAVLTAHPFLTHCTIENSDIAFSHPDPADLESDINYDLEDLDRKLGKEQCPELDQLFRFLVDWDDRLEISQQRVQFTATGPVLNPKDDGWRNG